MPYIKSVQVDGGREFRGLMELWKGLIDLRDAFYSRYEGPWNAGELSKALECYIKHDNEERCHTAIGVPPHFYAQSLRIAA